MESKVYTAQEMRYAADLREAWGDKDEVNNMLRWAADMMEREAKRKKKYEYAEMYSNGDVGHEKGDSIDDVNRFLSDGSIIVRREVGEWKEVKNA